jgi:hypothetical protein
MNHNELCRRAVKENNLTALRFLLQDHTYPNPIELINISIKRFHFTLLNFLLEFYPWLDCSEALKCAVKQNNLTALKSLLHNPITSVNYAIHLAYKYLFLEAFTILMSYKNKYLSDLKESLPTFVVENLLKTTLLRGDETFYRLLVRRGLLRRLIKDTDGLLLFLARNHMRDLFLHYICLVGIRDHGHVSRRLLAHQDPYFTRWAAYGLVKPY